ncbi:MAG: hypothetical protein HN904_24860 [Victivallales bacterium]|jgi:hypothetical protein|nr:hypothetical protein [Victivallales bacterium]
MGLLDKIAELFGRAPAPQAAAATGEQKKPARQVYGGPEIEPPEWAASLPKAKLMEACTEQAVCRFKPHIELKRIMSTRRQFDGNLETEYDGIAGGCGALKTFGLTVAKRDGQLTPYRYVDLNHIYGCCCSNFKRCIFYEMASGEAQDLQSRQRRI